MKIISKIGIAMALLFNLQAISFASPQDVSEYKSLFNGTDMSGWDGDTRLWSVKDGVIHGETTPENRANKNTFLVWKNEVKDFDLKLSFRCNATNNSGIQYRSERMPAHKDNRWRVKGYQHEIRNENTLPNVPSFIYDEGGKRKRICLAGEKAEWDADGKKTLGKLMTDEEVSQLVKIDNWNDVRIVAQGNHIQHYLNGKLILDFTDNHPQLARSKGVLALQLHAGKPMWAEFKDIKLRSIDSGSPKKITSGTSSAAMDVWPELAPGETTAITGLVQPGKKGENPPVTRVGEVTKPTFKLYPAAKPNGGAVLVVPGGGFRILAADLEGTEIASWLNGLGYHAFVLHYRVSNDPNSDQKRNKAVQDAQRTMSIIRASADKYGIDQDRIGIIGFSAGGFTAASLLAADGKLAYEKMDQVDEAGAKADFAMLLYPAVEGIGTGAHYPPTFIVHTHDDFIPADQVAMFYAKLKQAKVPAELHIFSNGGHGYGLRPRKGSNVSSWTNQAAAFLKQIDR
jgi:acetyl esterase/lipase